MLDPRFYRLVKFIQNELREISRHGLFPDNDNKRDGYISALEYLLDNLPPDEILSYTDQEIDDTGVGTFFLAMKEKLAQKRTDGKQGWADPSEVSADELSVMLRDHVAKGDPIDVANFCMMLWFRGDRIC